MSSQPHPTTQLTWHNTLPEDFRSHKAPSNPEPAVKSLAPATAGRKRHSASLEGLNVLTSAPDDKSRVGRSGTEVGGKPAATVAAVASPTKRHRTANAKPKAKTPANPATPSIPAKTAKTAKTAKPAKSTKPAARPPSAVSGKLSDSGMQTPPPSSAGALEKKGRIPQRAASASKAAATARFRVLSPPPTSPSKLHASSTSTLNSHHLVQRGRRAAAARAAGIAAEDEYARKALVWDDGLALGRGDDPWAAVGPNSFAAASQLAADDRIFSSSALNARAVSPVRTDHTASDSAHSAHFSFMHAAADHSDLAPAGVDPNLLFSEPSSATSSMVDGFNGRPPPLHLTPSQKPYHHQNLQRQRELDERLKRRQQLAAARSRDDLVGGRRRPDPFQQHLPASATPVRRTLSSVRSFGGEAENARPVSRSLSSPTKSTRTRAQVVLAIAADGRAQCKTTVIREPSPPAVVAAAVAAAESSPPGSWDSLEESDSSLDGDSPRGLAPDGTEYQSYRRRRLSASDLLRAPQPTVDMAKPQQPRTPQKQPPGLFVMPAAMAGRSRLDSSPRLPTPLKSSPPPLRKSHSSIATINRRIPRFQDAEDDGSEAETVVDGGEDEAEDRDGGGDGDDDDDDNDDDDGDDNDDGDGGIGSDEDGADGDALTALKRMLARSRGGEFVQQSPASCPCRFLITRARFAPCRAADPMCSFVGHQFRI